jgi:hypothetical protein
MVRRWLSPEVIIRSSLLIPVPHRAWGVVFPIDLLWYDRCSCHLVWFHVSSFWSMVVIFGGGCYSGALVLWGLSTMASRLYTTTRSTTYDKFFLTRRGWGKDSGAPSAPFGAGSVC